MRIRKAVVSLIVSGLAVAGAVMVAQPASANVPCRAWSEMGNKTFTVYSLANGRPYPVEIIDKVKWTFTRNVMTPPWARIQYRTVEDSNTITVKFDDTTSVVARVIHSNGQDDLFCWDS